MYNVNTFVNIITSKDKRRGPDIGPYTKYMKTLTYQTAATVAIKEFDYYRKSLVKEIENDAQFRQLTVYESNSRGGKLTFVLYGLQFCSAEGDNYREVMIGVGLYDGKAVADLRLYTIKAC